MSRTLSSTAKRTYWLGRYLERAENTARIVSVNANLLIDLPVRLPLGWQPLVDITGADELFADIYEEPSETHVVHFLLSDLRNSGSLFNSLTSAKENARTLRGMRKHRPELPLPVSPRIPQSPRSLSPPGRMPLRQRVCRDGCGRHRRR